MGAERELFIDIDRQPESERPRPPSTPAAQNNERASPRQSSPSPAPTSQNLYDEDMPTLPSVYPDTPGPTALPVPGWEDDLAVLPTMPLDPHLVEGLAALAPRSSKTRPLTLADALAAMGAAEPSASLTPTMPLPPTPAAPVEPPTAAPQPSPSEPPADWPGRDGIYRVRVSDEIPPALPLPTCQPEATDDEYLVRTYDLAYPAAAEVYERAVVPLWSAPFGRMLLSVFQGYPRQPGWQVVDIGCGTGYPTLDLAKLLEPDGDVAGVDLWGAGIEHARARASELRQTNVAFLVADIAACDLPERSFDTAICNLGLTSFAQPDAALKGIARLLQPNGTLILTTNLKGTMREFFETYRAVLNDLGLLDLSWDVERLMHAQPTMERVEGLLDIAGFTIDQTLNDHFALEFPDGSTFLRSPMVGIGFLQSWCNVISDLSLRRVVFNEIERRLNARAATWGRLDVMVPMLCVTARRRTQE